MSETESQSSYEQKPSKRSTKKSGQKPSKREQSKEPSKLKKGRKPKAEKKQKPAKGGEKAGKKKKQSKPKDMDVGDLKQLVFDYMQKQNRPYNLLNIYDNLHGKHKKPALQVVLNELAEEKKLSCKEFGKNKVYFLNQDNLNVSKEEVEKISKLSNQLREEEVQLGNQYRSSLDELKKVLAKKTLLEIMAQIDKVEKNIDRLEIKAEQLTNVDAQKIDVKEVEKVEKEQKILRKELSKRRRLTKDCLKTWSQILEKKVADVADMMGVEL